MNFYSGTRNKLGVSVYKNGVVLSPVRSLKVRNHSPTGFEWGYSGSGPAKLALAILLEEMDEVKAQECYQRFKHEKVALLDHHEWCLSSNDIKEWSKSK